MSDTWSPPWAKPRPVRTPEQHEAMRTVLQFWNWANLCHCGNTHLLLRDLRIGLDCHPEPGQDGMWDRTQAWIKGHYWQACTLDAWRLTEHGSSVYGSWLTTTGIRLRDALRLINVDDGLDFDGWSNDEYARFPQGRPGQADDEPQEGRWEEQPWP